MTHTLRPTLLALAASALAAAPSHAFDAVDLPADNLVENPWFQSPANPSVAGFGTGVWLRETWEGTTQLASASGDQRPSGSLTFGLTQKVSNPAPDPAPACGGKPYCGTGARWAEDRSAGCSLERAGVDAYARQIVAAGDPSHRRLRFSAWWVSHRIAVAEVTIAGAAGPSGPWTNLWTPLHVASPDVDLAAQVPGPKTDRSVEWRYLTCGTTSCAKAPIVETVLAQGHAFYRIELHARYPELQQPTCDVGAKLTGIYFATAAAGGGGGGGRDLAAPDGAGLDGAADAPEAGCRAAAPGGSLLLAALGLLGLRRRVRRAA